MEANCILNAFVVSARQYVSSPIEPNLLNLQRHLDIVTSLTASKPFDPVFDPQQLLAIECFSCLINIILDYADKPFLVQRAIKIFINLGGNAHLLEVLQSKFQITSALSLFLHNYGFSTSDTVISECFQLLELVTQDAQISYVDTHLQALIDFLLAEMDNLSSTIYNAVLHILSNLCRRNISVRNYIGNLKNAKQIYKSLIAKLCSPIYTSVVYAISILASVTYNNHKCEKVFTPKHVIEAFELIVLLLVNKDEVSSEAALNLFLDFYEMHHIFQSYVRYPKLEKAMTRVVSSCNRNTPYHQLARRLKFLWVFTKSPDSLPKVCNILCTVSGDKKDKREINSILMRINEVSDITLHNSDFLLYALKLVESFLVGFSVSECELAKSSFINFLKNSLQLLEKDVNFSSPFLKKQLEIYTTIFDILFDMSKMLSLHGFIESNLKLETCEKIISDQLDKNILSYDVKDWSESGVNLLLATLRCIIVGKQNTHFAKFLSKYLMDSRLMPFLGFALSSSCKLTVNRSLFIITSVSSELPLHLLQESISTANHYRQKSYCESDESSTNNSFASMDSSFEKSKSRIRDDSTEKNVEILIQRINNGLDLKNLKASEILDIYEHKISSLIKKEEELQNLVLSQSTTLQQSEKVLSQYKFRQTERDAEAYKLRMLLRESERRSEIAKDQSDQAAKKYRSLETQMETVRNENSMLAIKNQEQKDINGELNERLTMLLAEHEEDKRSFLKQLKEKDVRIKELAAEIQNYEELLKKRNEEYHSLEAVKNDLKSLYGQKEKAFSKLEQEMKVLELVCQQRESVIAEKDNTIKSLSEDLEKFKYVTGMIHEMSSKINHKESFHPAKK